MTKKMNHPGINLNIQIHKNCLTHNFQSFQMYRIGFGENKCYINNFHVYLKFSYENTFSFVLSYLKIVSRNGKPPFPKNFVPMHNGQMLGQQVF